MFENHLFTDRSAIQEFRDCPRKRFLSRHFKKRGITPKEKSIPLTTGAEVHQGVQDILTAVKMGGYKDPETLESAIVHAKVSYGAMLDAKGLRDVNTSLAKDFTYGEQRAQIEALLRVWHLRELPRLVDRFDIVSVEEDRLIPFGIRVAGKELFYQVKVDAILRDKQTKDYFVYSLKTTKRFDKRIEESYKVDMQGLSEIWGTQQNLDKASLALRQTLEGLGEGMSYLEAREARASQKYLDFIKEASIPDRIMGVVFCFLIKGERKEIQDLSGSGTRVYFDDSPLLRGLRKFDPGGVTYAHSWYYPKAENKSGWGRLGQGWEAFNVWQEPDFSLAKWIEDLNQGRIQAECGDVIGKHVITPVEYFRRDEEIEEWILGAREQERQIFSTLSGITGDWERDRILLSQIFYQNRKSCFFPTRCDFVPFCHKAGVKDSPFDNPDFEYEWREPHHEFEREQHLALFREGDKLNESRREDSEGVEKESVKSNGEGEDIEIEI